MHGHSKLECPAHMKKTLVYTHMHLLHTPTYIYMSKPGPTHASGHAAPLQHLEDEQELAKEEPPLVHLPPALELEVEFRVPAP